jgi:flagellar protein FliO/FliZ
MQIILSLFLVLAAIVLAAWLLKRMNVAQQGAGQQLKVLGGVSIGQRERIVLVEVGSTWLLVGVGPGQIRTLHTLPRMEDAEAADSPPGEAPPSGNTFARLLAPLLDRRKQDAVSK